LPTSPNGTIVAEHVWKRFRADKTRPQMYDRLAKLGKRIKGNAPKRSYRWVLKDVNFEVEPGGTLALVGINGSGKSTMLKIICRATYQTTGRLEAFGRIGALLEVKSGIQPILSGRENIYLYGNVLGLTRKQITQKFDTIVEFAELSDAIDRQVKFYSSGMTVRLGFSIAAHLDPDILLVDEVLAVGDANFQQRCLARISEVVQEGTTLLFVSHDLAAVEAMCDNAVWLADAQMRASGPTRQVLAKYRSAIEANAAMAPSTHDVMRVLKVEGTSPDGGDAVSGGDLDARIMINSSIPGNGRFYIGVSEGPAMPIFVLWNDHTFPFGDFELRCRLKSLPVPRGQYYVWLAVHGPAQVRPLLKWKPVGAFQVQGPNVISPPKGVMALSPVWVDSDWSVS
jgi:ABC-type polysaccharide/polyol phosphate transport system ATPase subunit